MAHMIIDFFPVSPVATHLFDPSRRDCIVKSHDVFPVPSIFHTLVSICSQEMNILQ